MLKTGLEFAKGTTETNQRLIAQLYSPGDILAAYRAKRLELKTGDLILIGSDTEQGFKGFRRLEYVAHLKRQLAEMGRPATLPQLYEVIEHRSAHQIVQLPFESDAFWLFVARGNQNLAVMVAMYASPYEEVGSSETPADSMLVTN